MRNTFLAARRDARAHLFGPLDPFDETLASHENYDTSLELMHFNRIWNRLNSDHREILRLLCEGEHYLDIAERFQIPLGTVQSRAHFARRAFRQEIDLESTGRSKPVLH